MANIERKFKINQSGLPDDITATAAFCQYNTSYLFYSKYLIPSIKNKNDGKRSNGENAETVHFELAEVHGSLRWYNAFDRK